LDRIPASPDAIDVAWLNEALAPRHARARVAAVEVADRAEMTNHHSMLRVAYDEPDGCPTSLFCKLLPTHEPFRSAVARTGMGLREARFYERLAPYVDMRVPEAYVARCDPDEGSFVLLLEDLAATGCTIPDGLTGVPPDSVFRAIEDLAALHVRYADPAHRAREADWVPPPLMNVEYGRGMLKVGLDQHRDRLADEFAAIAQCYVDTPEAMHALWDEGPTTVIHGDPHIGNLFDDHGRTGFLDWGILSTGNPLRDVSYFLNVALSIEDRREREVDLLRHYLERWNAGPGPPIDFDTAWRTHRIHGAYCVVACCQIVTFPEYESEGHARFLDAFLKRAEAAVADLDSLAALREAGIP